MDMADRRGARRQKSFLRGVVYFDKRRGALNCLVRDFSEQGARIIFSETVIIPKVVNLYIPQREENLRAVVQWRHGDEIGLAFTAATEIDRPEPERSELVKRVAELEGEITKLRRRLKRLQQELPNQDDEVAA